MNKNAKLGAEVALAGAKQGVFAVSRKKKAQTVKQTRKQRQELADYRNTERGMHEKNSKGIYYTNGNYEAFARPEKPEGIENKSAYIVGADLAHWQLPVSLVRDAQMPGKKYPYLRGNGYCRWCL